MRNLAMWLLKNGTCLGLTVLADLFACHAALAQPTSISVQKRVDAGTFVVTEETAAAASQQNPLVAVATWNYEPFHMGAAVTSDGGGNWSQALINGLPGTNYFDPMAGADRRTGTLWVGGVWTSGGMSTPPKGLWVAKWTGTAFEASRVFDQIPNADKPHMCIGPRPGQPNLSRMYVVYTGLGGRFLTWADYDDVTGQLGPWHDPPTSVQPAPTGGDVSGPLVRVGPEGQLYLIFWDESYGVWLHRVLVGDPPAALANPISVATRLDTWPIFHAPDRIPGWFRKPPWAYLAVDPLDGTLYCVYFDTTRRLCYSPPPTCLNSYDVDIWFTKSPAQPGQTPGDVGTWTTPKVINVGDGPPYDQFFPWIEVDHNHRIHVVFYDTLGGPFSSNNDQSGFPEIRARYAYSTDGGAHWAETTLSPNWSPSPPATWPAFVPPDSTFMGDYNGLAVTTTRVYPVYMSTLGPANPSTPNRDIFSNEIIWP